MDTAELPPVHQLLRAVPHPYVGVADDRILEGYEDIVLSSEYIMGIFFSVIGVTVSVLWLITGHVQIEERLQLIWLFVSGLIHMLVEGSFVLNVSTFFKNTDPNMFMFELWKDYAKADSRYATGDSAVLAIEGVTSFLVGPMCVLAAAGLFAKSSWRYALITILSVFQFYGTVLYFLTSWLEGLPHTRPEPLYLWFYFVVMNGIWIILPALCTWDSLCKMTSAVRASSMTSKKLA